MYHHMVVGGAHLVYIVVPHLPMASDAIESIKGERTAKLRFRHMLGGSDEEEQPPWSVVS